MPTNNSGFNANLFYSYCHKDIGYKKEMEKSLVLLKRNRVLRDWSDQQITPGKSISRKIRTAMDRADIVVFLISQDFLASDACMDEWERAKSLERTGKLVVRVPIILTDCTWIDLLGEDDIKSLPNDGKPVCTFDHESTAWTQIYDGIKKIIDDLRKNFSPNEDFIKKMQETEFLSQTRIALKDIYIFLPLTCYAPSKNGFNIIDSNILEESQLLEKDFSIIHGIEMSGKSALTRNLFLTIAEQSKPVLLIDLKRIPSKPTEKIFEDEYRKQFYGDYNLWKKKENKTLILDNLTSEGLLVEFILFAKDIFERIVVTVSSDIYFSFFRDDTRLADFKVMKIEPLTHAQQEDMIRKRLTLKQEGTPVTDGYVDQIEERLNSIIISNKIVPRYPFYVLSILQTYEAFMPDTLSVSSYGHCYQALIVANLIKAGISKNDSDINACFNFAENLAFHIYQTSETFPPTDHSNNINLQDFITSYRKDYVISNATLI